jgi:hypothetical protein
MAARPLTPVSEQNYLGSSYQPDCEFEDGVLIERHVRNEKHSWMQIALGSYIFRRRRAWGVTGYTQQRVRIQGLRSATRSSSSRPSWSRDSLPG